MANPHHVAHANSIWAWHERFRYFPRLPDRPWLQRIAPANGGIRIPGQPQVSKLVPLPSSLRKVFGERFPCIPLPECMDMTLQDAIHESMLHSKHIHGEECMTNRGELLWQEKGLQQTEHPRFNVSPLRYRNAKLVVKAYALIFIGDELAAQSADQLFFLWGNLTTFLKALSKASGRSSASAFLAASMKRADCSVGVNRFDFFLEAIWKFS
jgi:hypothetical protein